MPLLSHNREQVAAFQAQRRGRPSLHTLRVSDLEVQADDAVVVTFAVPDHLREAYRFKHGQHVAIVHDDGGEEIRRSYSICSPAGSDVLRIAIRRVAGGRFSTYATSQLRVDDELRVMTPTGRFTTALDPLAEKHYLAVAGGSGITPIISMAATILGEEPRSRFTLLYANRSRRSTMFMGELDSLCARFGPRLSVIYYWDDAVATAAGPLQRLDRGTLEGWLAADPPGGPVDQWIMCGPAGLIDFVTETLVDCGLAEEKILREYFIATEAEDSDAAQGRPLVLSNVRVRIDGEELNFELSSHGATILAAALPLRPDLPYSCSDGVCATCRVKVLEGSVEMDRCSALDRKELSSGYVLACQAHPTTDSVVVDFDG
ncbi:2Fe-2S iron-sulfur cluster binding domain-containing protein (plasmid) [Rhodococcus pyridinivorans]|uniref:2Fe-2S iron-sulfur cluster-binding protein n=1 Tax=Rhodococcus pyridinivorans TaxID=103816 RepID=UPI001C30F981|nr:2Fe-2S iron-sulfur cluster-binding protein [Rhodococcus pyridinivorans]QXF84327.1 2Fe-2S iron-sulfur cluster binding domain-containing protein [Rhodococcus pyridinivorans]